MERERRRSLFSRERKAETSRDDRLEIGDARESNRQERVCKRRLRENRKKSGVPWGAPL